MRHPGKPFRWNVSNPELGKRLGKGDVQALPDYQIDRLLRCAATTLRMGEFDFVLVGRSLESVLDLLSGALARTAWYDRVQHLQISARGKQSIFDLRDEYLARYRKLVWKPRDLTPFGSKLDSFHNYLEYLQLTPQKLLSRPRPVAFVDIVHTGKTFGLLWELLQLFADDDETKVRLADRIHWVAVLPALTEQDRETPWNASDSTWTHSFPSSVHCVNLDPDLWCWLADSQFKSTHAHGVRSWDGNTDPPEYSWTDYAARGARECYRVGERARKRLAALLGEAPEPIDGVKQLARELRREAKSY